MLNSIKFPGLVLPTVEALANSVSAGANFRFNKIEAMYCNENLLHVFFYFSNTKFQTMGQTNSHVEIIETCIYVIFEIFHHNFLENKC